MNRLIIVGAGGFGGELLSHVINSPRFLRRENIELIEFIDDSKALGPAGHRVAGAIRTFRPGDSDKFILGMGDPSVREEFFRKISSKGGRFLNFVDDTVKIGVETVLGNGVVICPGTNVTSNVHIGEGCLINLNCSIGHGSNIGQFSVVHSNTVISGDVSVGKAATIGGGSAIAPGVRIADSAFVGIGSIVIRNVKESSRVFGNPAKPVPRI